MLMKCMGEAGVGGELEEMIWTEEMQRKDSVRSERQAGNFSLGTI